MPILHRRKVSHVNSSTLEERDWYSASILDLETIGCHLDDQDTQFTPS